MDLHPILLFPTPNITSPTPRRGGGTPPHTPTVSNQSIRLGPKFGRLQRALEDRRIEIVDENPDIDPEYTIVIETYGHVSEFFKATKKIEGLEWLGEYETKDLAPEGDFYDEKNREKPLNGRVMLLLSDRQAINELLSLWNNYGQDPSMEFERGWAKFRDVFKLLKDIRYWSAIDRIHDTGVMEYWEETLEHEPQSPVRFETELWYRNNEQKRTEALSSITDIVNSYQGQIIANCCISSINYHSLLIELPASHVDEIVRNQNVSLVKCDDIMFFRPLGQMCVDPIVGEEEINTDGEQGGIFDHSNVIGQPQVALLDGLPLVNHTDLLNKLIIDDPDDFANGYIASGRKHGTAMASLIINGDLSDNLPPLTSPLYVRPILKYNAHSYRPMETIPTDVLPLDLIHRAVKRMFDGEGVEPPTAPEVKVINMSIGDPNIQFTGKMSPFARLIDWLSAKYNVLFIISAGNHSKPITLEIPAAEFRALSTLEQQKKAFESVHRDTRNRKLLSPAESINAITVGAIHNDSSSLSLRGGKLDLYGEGMPSVYSAHGNGYNRSVKPDIAFTGGRVIHNEPIGEPILNGVWLNSPPGIFVPHPDPSGDLSKRVYSRGTSNAAALTTRGCLEILAGIEDIFVENDLSTDFDNYASLLAKSLIAHGASWDFIHGQLSDYLSPLRSSKLKEAISQHVGYGKPDIEKVKYCIDTRATLLGYGSLLDSEAHIFKLPIPQGLGGVNIWRKLTITLSWFAEPVSQNIKYRDSALWLTVEGENNNLAPQRTYEWLQVRRGTLQHEVFEGDAITVLSQSSELEIKVNCKKDAAARLNNPIKYGLAITLEVAPDIELEIYQEIKDAIDIQIQQQVETPIRAL
jgi:hypothetical protein